MTFSSFEFLRQILRVSNQTQKLEVMNNVREFLGMDNEKGEQVEFALHSNISLYEQEDNQPSVI